MKRRRIFYWLLSITLLYVCFSIVSNLQPSKAMAEESRWKFIGSDETHLFPDRENKIYIDEDTIEYDKTNKSIYYWEKELLLKKGKEEKRLFHMKYVVGKPYVYGLTITKFQENGSYQTNPYIPQSLGKRDIPIFIYPDSNIEKMVNFISDAVGQKRLYSVYPHSWKKVLSADGKTYEICTDVFFYDHKTDSAIVMIKTRYDKGLVTRECELFDFANQKYAYPMITYKIDFSEKPRVKKWHDIIPDTTQEYLFRAAKLLAKGN